MRPRKIRNLKTRRENCTDLRIPYTLESFDFRTNDEHENFFDLDEIFGRSAPLVMEIGCGKGQFTCEYAKRNPDKNILAIECVPTVLVEACELVKRENITNIRFLEMKAEYLPLFMREKSVTEIYLNFSTPFPKSRQESHRLTSKGFLDIYKKLLCDDGFIAQKTDSQGFFEYSLESFSQNGFLLSEISLDLHNSDFEGNIVTEYEEKFVSQGLPIYRLVAKMK
ncbi:MAG: tRNA (guanosine(46)-N7)-methyltransferase TrmB [Clostridia bacterium]|nr:tRNA (guanosine(46)-N7)-methyltransferase TrmB [Clostridia bacterium]MBR2953239.1 tRNA (guanosine(46)-N7)-methyltransferase TrmB [Clostridia bacterium]